MARILAAMMLVLASPGLAASLDERLPTCLACHGDKGQSETTEVPSLGAQPAAYLLIQLYLFREQMRRGEPMNEMAKGLSDDDLRAFSDAIARLPPPHPAAVAPDPARMEQGKALVMQNRCNFCHAADLGGQDQVPRLAAQREDYLLKALRDYKSGGRVGYDATMLEVIRPLGEPEFTALAYYLARLP
jgi:cytochrome c553